MKTILAIALLLVTFTMSSRAAQQDSIFIKSYYHFWVLTKQGRQVKHGVPIEIKDSSFLMTNTAKKKKLQYGNCEISEMYPRDIQSVLVQSSSKHGLEKKIGASTGILAGILIGASQYSKWNDHSTMKTKEGKNLENVVEACGFILIACVSTVTGALIGHIADQIAKKRISIAGDQELFDAAKPQLMLFTINKMTGDSSRAWKYVKPLTDTLADIDGNKYKLIALGGMVWMGENLRVTRYSNGDTIPSVSVNDDWNRLNTGACCNAVDHLSGVKNCGKLYNRQAVLDKRNICPRGWHVPTYAEWQSLITFFGGESRAGAGLKGYNKQTQFTSLAGYCEPNGDRVRAGESGMYWWSDYTFDERIIGLKVGKSGTNVSYIEKEQGMNTGLSVRCIRDVNQ